MQTPIEIRATDFPLTDALTREVNDGVAKLEEHYGRIVHCRVSLSGPATHHRKGTPFEVCIDLTVPGGEYVAHHRHEDLYVAIRGACKTARRQLEDHAHKRRRETKIHVHHPHARVARLLDDHGYLDIPDGRQLYFHRNSVMRPAFDALEVGMEVSFVERHGDKGPHASTVARVGGPALGEEVRVPT